MKPGLDQILMTVATTLATRILPELDPQSYATGDAKMAAMLAMFVAQESDRAADTLARENREMRGIFLAASRQDLPAPMRVRLQHDAALEEADLKLGTLSAAHDRYAETLIALQTFLEGSDEDWARELNREIWNLLLQGTECRMLVMPAA